MTYYHHHRRPNRHYNYRQYYNVDMSSLIWIVTKVVTEK